MPIKVMSKRACAQMMIEGEHCGFKDSLVSPALHAFTEEQLIFLCGEIIEACRQNTELDIAPSTDQEQEELWDEISEDFDTEPLGIGATPEVRQKNRAALRKSLQSKYQITRK